MLSRSPIRASLITSTRDPNHPNKGPTGRGPLQGPRASAPVHGSLGAHLRVRHDNSGTPVCHETTGSCTGVSISVMYRLGAQACRAHPCAVTPAHNPLTAHMSTAGDFAGPYVAPRAGTQDDPRRPTATPLTRMWLQAPGSARSAARTPSWPILPPSTAPLILVGRQSAPEASPVRRQRGASWRAARRFQPYASHAGW